MVNTYKLFSVDDHILEPPNVWIDRVSQDLAESAPGGPFLVSKPAITWSRYQK
jgi:hypothetical protein